MIQMLNLPTKFIVTNNSRIIYITKMRIIINEKNNPTPLTRKIF